MATAIPFTMKRKDRIWQIPMLSDLFFLTGFLIIAYMFKGAVHELLFIPYMLFSLFNAAYLIMPSRYNKGRKNYESLAVMMKKDVLVYRPYYGKDGEEDE